MDRAISTTVIFTIGIAWGVFAFLRGLAGSFTLNSIGLSLIKDLAALMFGFLLILPITIAAIWKPKISAALLALSFFAVDCVVFADDGLHGMVLVAKKLGLPTIWLVCGYIYAASVQAKAQPRTAPRLGTFCQSQSHRFGEATSTPPGTQLSNFGLIC